MQDRTEEFSVIFETLALDDTLAAEEMGETIRRDSPPARLADSLPTLDLDHHGESTGAELKVGQTLGEGGMGIVRQATQEPIGREVALKTVRGARARDATVGRALLREAFVAGRLEHPHVVPIYAVGQDREGRPVIVMKKIEGATWQAFLAGEEPVPSDDELRWHLDIFHTVCTVVHFAHARGILHRDIKPENVMIGEHGEVYLVDWGLAVTVEEDKTGRLPWVREPGGVCGTPNYMAPEMAANLTDEQDARTDVYLLGAVLHELVTGEPRHGGKALFEVMLTAYQSEPVDYEDDVPAELAAICNRATARARAGRYASALELRDAVQEFLDHRAAAALAREAADELERLEAVSADDSREPDERRVAVYRHYGASRFGFEQALDEWTDNDVARDGLQKTLTAMIEWELQHGSIHAAAAMLAELPEPDARLEEALRDEEARRRQREEELDELRDFRRQRDVAIGSSTRSLFLFLLIVFALIIPGVLMALGIIDPVPDPILFWGISVFLALGVLLPAGFGLVGRGPLPIEDTATNRRLVGSTVIFAVFLVFFRALGVLFELGIPVQLTMELAVLTMFISELALAFDRRILRAAPFYAVACVATFLWPAHAMVTYMVGNSGALGMIVWVWARTPSRKDDTPSLSEEE